MFTELEAKIIQADRERVYRLPRWAMAEQYYNCRQAAEDKSGKPDFRSTGGSAEHERGRHCGFIRRILPGA